MPSSAEGPTTVLSGKEISSGMRFAFSPDDNGVQTTVAGTEIKKGRGKSNGTELGSVDDGGFDLCCVRNCVSFSGQQE